MVSEQHQHLWKQAAQEHFHRWAEHYDQDVINILLFRPSYQRVLAQLRQWQRRGRKHLRILDVGCGTGSLMMLCLQLQPPALVDTVVGLDMSENMIAKARQKIALSHHSKRSHLTIGDAEHLPFEGDSFDVVTCCNSFHHYPHKDRAVSEMYRVLRPNGNLILIDGARDEPFGYFIFEICVAHVENHVHHCTRREFHNLLTQVGFVDIFQNVFGVCPPALMNVARVQK